MTEFPTALALLAYWYAPSRITERSAYWRLRIALAHGLNVLSG